MIKLRYLVCEFVFILLLMFILMFASEKYIYIFGIGRYFKIEVDLSLT